MDKVELENIQSVADTYSLILTLQLSEAWNSFNLVAQCWSLELRSSGIELLPFCDRQKLDRILADKLVDILKSDHEILLSDLRNIREAWSKEVLAQASELLGSERSILKKMVILQNISNGEKAVDKPWEVKIKKTPPKRPEFSKKILAKV
jgi:hypothetical protein